MSKLAANTKLEVIELSWDAFQSDELVLKAFIQKAHCQTLIINDSDVYDKLLHRLQDAPDLLKDSNIKEIYVGSKRVEVNSPSLEFSNS